MNKNATDLVRLYWRVDRLMLNWLENHVDESNIIMHFLALDALSREETLRMKDLAAILSITAPSITAMVSRFEERGWIKRSTDERDKRITYIQLTESGQVEHERYLEIMAEFFDRYLSGEERLAYLRAMEAIAAKLDD
jgi:DNA-binding MarR family transcriptional regulator